MQDEINYTVTVTGGTSLAYVGSTMTHTNGDPRTMIGIYEATSTTLKFQLKGSCANGGKTIQLYAGGIFVIRVQ